MASPAACCDQGELECYNVHAPTAHTGDLLAWLRFVHNTSVVAGLRQHLNTTTHNADRVQAGGCLHPRDLCTAETHGQQGGQALAAKAAEIADEAPLAEWQVHSSNWPPGAPSQSHRKSFNTPLGTTACSMCDHLSHNSQAPGRGHDHDGAHQQLPLNYPDIAYVAYLVQQPAFGATSASATP